jgi:hypothetical protein
MLFAGCVQSLALRTFSGFLSGSTELANLAVSSICLAGLLGFTPPASFVSFDFSVKCFHHDFYHLAGIPTQVVVPSVS